MVRLVSDTSQGEGARVVGNDIDFIFHSINMGTSEVCKAEKKPGLYLILEILCWI